MKRGKAAEGSYAAGHAKLALHVLAAKSIAEATFTQLHQHVFTHYYTRSKFYMFISCENSDTTIRICFPAVHCAGVAAAAPPHFAPLEVGLPFAICLDAA